MKNTVHQSMSSHDRRSPNFHSL